MPVGQFIKELFPPYKKWLLQTDTFGDEVAKTILKNKDLDALKHVFDAIPNRWSDRYFYSLAMSRHFPVAVLKHWAESQRTSADAHLVYGARFLKWSWEARGYGSGRTISKDKRIEFYRRLALTRELLEESARLHPGDPTPWAYLIMVAVYSQAGEEAERRYFEQAIERDPSNWTAHMHRLTGLTAKYGGSHAEMFKFARESASSARQGSLVPILLTKAHSEYWKYLSLFEGNHEGARKYLQERDAHDETLEAYRRTLGSNRYDKREATFARINAAGWFWLIKSRDALRDELRALDGSIHDVHWRWVGTEYDLAKAKRYAGLQ